MATVIPGKYYSPGKQVDDSVAITDNQITWSKSKQRLTKKYLAACTMGRVMLE